MTAVGGATWEHSFIRLMKADLASSLASWFSVVLTFNIAVPLGHIELYGEESIFYATIVSTSYICLLGDGEISLVGILKFIWF